MTVLLPHCFFDQLVDQVDTERGRLTYLHFFADRAAKKWPLRGSLKLG
jgi:hypothetical protein